MTSCPADIALADLLAGSDVVLVGKMQITRQRLLDQAQKTSPDDLDIPIQVDSVLKGGAIASATVRFYPDNAPYKPATDAVLSLVEAPAILFLKRVDEAGGGLYFAGHSPQALQPATKQAIAAAQAEVARQAQIIGAWRADTTLPRSAEVRALIGRLGGVSGDEQQRVFQQLEALGDVAVPAIIQQMDDRRPLQTRAITLVNHQADAFERARSYGPERVVDALDAILNQITGASFGSIGNGGSDRERDAAVAGWRIYAADLACRGPQ